MSASLIRKGAWCLIVTIIYNYSLNFREYPFFHVLQETTII